MSQLWYRILNIGISSDVNEQEKIQIKLVNYISFFGLIAAILLFCGSLNYGNELILFGRAFTGFLFLTVLIINKYKKFLLSKLILFIGLCIIIGFHSIIENVNSLTINYYFGIGILSFVVFENFKSRLIGLLICIALYFIVKFIQIKYTSTLAPDPLITYLNILNLFASIAFCMNYFHTINNSYNKIILIQKNELEEINENKIRILSILTHDLMNPINSLNHLLNFQKDKVLSTNDLNFFYNKLRLDFTAQFESIQSILEWSKNQLSKIKVNISEIEVDKILTSLTKELNYNLTLKSINTKLVFCNNDNIYADKTHLLIILRNLLNNAIKFTNTNGNISIRTTNENNKYRIEIEDDGIGFEGYDTLNFVELNEFTTHEGTNNENGNGLGLTISKELAHKNNCKIYIKNGEIRGTIVRLEFSLY